LHPAPGETTRGDDGWINMVFRIKVATPTIGGYSFAGAFKMEVEAGSDLVDLRAV
jgi:hypothetical protein